MLPRSFFRLSAFGAVCTLFLVGCGTQRSDVKGTVTYKNKTVKMGSVTFLGMGSDKQAYSSPIDENGGYEIKGVPVGDVRILVDSTNPAAATGRGEGGRVVNPDDPKSKKIDNPDGAPKVDAKGWFAIPEIYSDIAKSPLKHTIGKAPSTHNITLD